MRITGGALRSRAVRAPKGMATRPTSDRVREGLFSMLVSAGLLGEDRAPRVLDLYAGSGALAFEALSRGAAAAVLIEHDRDALAAIRDNARAFGVEEKVDVLAGRVERALSRVDGSFEIVFVDPPYADVRTRRFADVLGAAARLVAPSGALVLEHASSDTPPQVRGLALDRARRHGDTTLSFFLPTDDA
jgi:16S rRNA (guanine966-N2)-methyltransferase